MKIAYSKEKIIKVIVIISIILISILLILVLYKSKVLQIIKNGLNDAKKEVVGTMAKYEIVAESGEEYEVLITIENQSGIERITAEDITIEGKGKRKIALDRTLKEGKEYQMKIKAEGEEEELYTLVASKKPNIVITNIDTTGDGTTKTVEIAYTNNENLKNYYSLDDGATWQEYKEELDILEVDNKTITAKSEWKEGKTIQNSAEKVSLIISDSLISAAGKAVIGNNRHYKIAIKDEEYTVHTYVENEDTTFTSNRTYGDANDVGTASANAKNMVLVKVDGNLSINSGVTVTTYGTAYGGPKGMLLYVTGNLENNGTVTMTARGAKAVGQNVYLWKNRETESEEYEYISKDGMQGGEKVRSTTESGRVGNNGANGTNRRSRRRRLRWILSKEL
ncbi:MAG: hypothetical protein HFJ42_05625 [Clostridia bacterium]|nr:hypothetical protein [Clostridia bacterium]